MNRAVTQAAPAAQAMDEAEVAQWQRWRLARDVTARETLIQRHLPFARIVAASYYARRRHDEIEFADYLQLAVVALLECIDRYCPDRGAQFRTFASRRMHGAILDGVASMTEKQQQIAARQRVRRERLQSVKRLAGDVAPGRVDLDEGIFTYLAEVGVGVALSILLEDTAMVDPDAMGRSTAPDQHYRRIELAQMKRRMSEMVSRLPEAQRRVLQLHYQQEHSFAEIARSLDLTKGRVAQIHRQALGALRGAWSDDGCNLAC